VRIERAQAGGSLSEALRIIVIEACGRSVIYRRDDDGKRVPMDLKAGDKVLFAKYAGTEIKVDGKKLLIMKETDILAIVN